MTNKKILVVDDSDFDRELLRRALESVGDFTVVEAASADECLAAFAAGGVDLILMDVMMPGGMGTEALRKIREKSNPIELPVILVTAKDKAADVVAGLRLGANDYLTKPIHLEITLSKIITHLTLAELSREAVKVKELTAVHAMVATFNHEINNPLTIALMAMEAMGKKYGDEETFKRASQAMWRIRDITRKIAEVTKGAKIAYEAYAGSEQMLKLRAKG